MGSNQKHSCKTKFFTLPKWTSDQKWVLRAVIYDNTCSQWELFDSLVSYIDSIMFCSVCYAVYFSHWFIILNEWTLCEQVYITYYLKEPATCFIPVCITDLLVGRPQHIHTSFQTLTQLFYIVYIACQCLFKLWSCSISTKSWQRRSLSFRWDNIKKDLSLLNLSLHMLSFSCSDCCGNTPSPSWSV